MLFRFNIAFIAPADDDTPTVAIWPHRYFEPHGIYAELMINLFDQDKNEYKFLFLIMNLPYETPATKYALHCEAIANDLIVDLVEDWQPLTPFTLPDDYQLRLQ